jgi:hypothetical protein
MQQIVAVRRMAIAEDYLRRTLINVIPPSSRTSITGRPDKDFQCNDPVGTCSYGTFLCDISAVQCFAHHRNTSYDKDFDDWQGICNETFTSPEVDSQRCPSVWNNQQKYASNSLVSINGIIYQSLFSTSLGENPKNHLHGSYIMGTVATWKKLGPCRRMNETGKF